MYLKKVAIFFLFLSFPIVLWAKLPVALDSAGIMKAMLRVKTNLSTENIPAAARLLTQISKDVKTLKNDDLTFKYLDLLRRFHGLQDKHERALEIANQMLSLALKIKNKALEADAYHVIGTEQKALGKLNLAIESVIKAIQIGENEVDKNKLPYHYLALANIFFELREPKKVIFYTKKANFLLKNNLKDSTAYAKNLADLSLHEMLDNQLDSSLIHLKIAEKIFEKQNNITEMVRVYLYYRHTYFAKKDYSTALFYLKKCDRLLNRVDRENFVRLHVESAFAETYYELKDYKKAKYYFDRNISQAEKIMDSGDIKSIYQLGSNINEKLGNLNEALSYLKKYKVYNDSVSNISMKNAIHETEIKYQTTIKEKALSEQKLQLVQKDYELTQKNKYIIYALILIIILVLGAAVIYLIYRNKNQAIELSLLKAQIHPHFLFNTLNNLYALSINKSVHAPAVVLGLSSILRYILYECNTLNVSLEKELAIISDYIALEKIRYKQKLEVNSNIEGNLTNINVAPLLILPLVENAFKHGVSKLIADPWINMETKLKDNKFIFKIANNKPICAAQGKNDGKYGNIGLLNIQKRLQILYPKKHKLKITNDEEVFIVVLELQLN